MKQVITMKYAPPYMLASGTGDMPQCNVLQKSSQHRYVSTNRKKLYRRGYSVLQTETRPRNAGGTVEIILKISPSFVMTKSLNSDSNGFLFQRPPSGVKSASSHQCQGFHYSQQRIFFQCVQILKDQPRSLCTSPTKTPEQCLLCHPRQLHRLLCDFPHLAHGTEA